MIQHWCCTFMMIDHGMLFLPSCIIFVHQPSQAPSLIIAKDVWPSVSINPSSITCSMRHAPHLAPGIVYQEPPSIAAIATGWAMGMGVRDGQCRWCSAWCSLVTVGSCLMTVGKRIVIVNDCHGYWCVTPKQLKLVSWELFIFVTTKQSWLDCNS